MPDLTVEAGFCCASNEHWQTKVIGSKGDEYIVVFGRNYDPKQVWDFGWTCTCPAYVNRHRRRGEICKHIRQVQDQRCAWNAEMESNLPVARDEKGENCCPQCKGPVVAFRASV